MKRYTHTAAILLAVALPSAVLAQAAGGGADFNKADRKEVRKQVEVDRLKIVDKPVRPDPIGNALIGGAVAGVVRGSATAAATGVASRVAIGTASNTYKDKNDSSK